jgi:hypothetical protein
MRAYSADIEEDGDLPEVACLSAAGAVAKAQARAGPIAP